MHRLQVCLPESQVQYLTHRARKEGVSIAELIRRLVEDATKSSNQQGTDSLWAIAGIGKEHSPLIDGIPVSERPGIYIADAIQKQVRPHKTRAARKRKHR